ncbi:uncharacterized protein LOC135374673 [Ornithodoros turicata]|uniref:uncharacterized protein LOC135374673 n=1 Tax=Ornithodoros turicata TaxID=34597 RepID=UPI003138D6C2
MYSSSAIINCLVLWKDRKKVVQISGKHGTDDLMAALRGTDFEDATESGRIEVYNARFDTFVDSSKDHIYCDGDKIKLVAHEGNVSPPSSAPEANSFIITPGDDPSNAQQSASRMQFRLPPVPFDIKVDISNTKFGEVPFRVKSRIVAWITTHLRTIHLYPGKLYVSAAKALVHEYPVLRDAIGTGYDSWKVAFQYKMGNVRKTLDTVPAVQEAREKFGHKRSLQGEAHMKRQCRLIPDAAGMNGEDQESVAAHIAFMKTEMKRRVPDVAKLSDSMSKTRSARRNWIHESSPTTAEVLERYPALTNGEMLHEEFQAITSIDLDVKLLSFLNKYGERCLYLSKSLRSAKETVRKLEDDLSKLQGDSKKYRFALGIIELLPLFVKEQPHFLNGPDIYPSLVVNEEDNTMYAIFEDLKVEVFDTIGGVTHLIEVYWIFNIKYSQKNKNFFSLLEHFCDLKWSRPPAPLVLRAISSIEQGP